MIERRVSFEEQALTDEEDQVQLTSQHEPGMASWIRGLARRYCILDRRTSLFLLAALAAVIVRVSPNLAMEITVFMPFASVAVPGAYYFSHGDWQKQVMELISGLLAAVLTVSLVRLVFPPVILEDELRFLSVNIMILSSFGVILLAVVVISNTRKQLVNRNGIFFRLAERALDSLRSSVNNSSFISAPPAVRTGKSAGQAWAEHDVVATPEEITSTGNIGKDSSSSSSSSFATCARDNDAVAECMRECLVYCLMFPADYEFSRDTLIWSWIAAGLINYEQHGEMEAVAIGCFDRLITSKHIVESGYDHLTDQMKYKLENDKFSVHNERPSELKYRKMLDGDGDLADVEHLSVIFEQIDRAQFERIRQCTHLKTLLLHKCFGSEFQNLLNDIFLEMKFLTTLDLSGTDIEELPSSIGSLMALRYLDMSGTPIRELPESIDSLGCLETLVLLQCLSLRGLPKCMCKLVKLRHLVLDLALLLQSMPTGVGKLMNLQTLGAFVVGRKDGHRIGELKKMNKLNGSLCLMKLENILNVDEAREACLSDKQYLSKLEFIWSDLEDAKVVKEEEILEYLKPHSHLRNLKIVSYSGGMLPSWLSDPSFTQMASITLYGCRYCERLSCLGELPSLKALNIVDMDEVVVIDKLFCQKHASQNKRAFPKLERLSLEGMSSLESWTGVEDSHFPRLQQLLLKYCPKLASLPTLSSLISLHHLEICYCPVLSGLPEGGLPPSLQCLMLKDCPKLKQRCCKEQGEDWDKVARVPTLYIDHQKISSSSGCIM